MLSFSQRDGISGTYAIVFPCKRITVLCNLSYEKVKVGNDQEKAQSERDLQCDTSVVVLCVLCFGVDFW